LLHFIFKFRSGYSTEEEDRAAPATVLLTEFRNEDQEDTEAGNGDHPRTEFRNGAPDHAESRNKENE
jgi:hypothetical protein